MDVLYWQTSTFGGEKSQAAMDKHFVVARKASKSKERRDPFDHAKV